MAQRTLDTAFWDDEDIARLSFPARLLFICMVTDSSLSDDYGCLPAHARGLRKHAFGYDDDVTVAQVLEWRNEILTKCRNIVFYEVEGQEYICLTKFQQWQQLRYRRTSYTPQPSDPRAKIAENCGNVTQDCANIRMSRVVLSRVGEDTAQTCDNAESAPAPEPTPPPVRRSPSKKRQPASTADPRTDHPAIQAIRTLTERNPNLKIYDILIAAIGDSPDPARLKDCYEAWLLHDYRPTNYAWVTDWYVNGIPGHGQQAPPKNKASPKRAPITESVDWTKLDTGGNSNGNGDGRNAPTTEQQTSGREPHSLLAH